MKTATLILLLMGAIMAMAENEIPLWDGNMPGKGAGKPEEVSPNKNNHVIRLTNVSEPTLAFYPAKDTGKPNPLVIICPGGGYTILAYNLEGTEVAEWLNSIGVSAAVLKYRVPNNRAGALADARRALRLVREHSKEWNIDPKRVGILGFSAGGHLAAACSNSSDRPGFTILIYPAYLAKNGVELVSEIKVGAHTPPAFIVQTQDDRSHYRSSLAYSIALDQQGIPVELHLFAKGGHGYGLRPSQHPVSQWPKLCEQWMQESGFLE
ncbi:MAG: alpha/beta hydrolase [Methylococcales bacterium]|nr:alpha/beta hydrolase [Methylococcales bacterium]